jgi:hypothetical protein
MAGKTLSGIGEDESGRHELGTDTSDPALDKAPDKPPSTRPTDRMPSYVGKSSTPTILGGVMPALGVGAIPGAPAGPGGPSIDDDKVAEGLKKLRSLDEPLGPIPTSPSPTTIRDGIPPLNFPTPVNPMAGTPTLKEGMPVVGLPTPVNPSALAAAAASELIRGRGTAHGHALSAAAGAPNALPVSIDDRLKGTLLGHDVHLPDMPVVPPEEQRPAEVRPVASASVSVKASTTGALVHQPMPTAPTAFAPGDSQFFDNEPVDNEFEPEQRRNKLLVRGAIAFAAVSIIVVAIVAWTSHKPETPAEAQATPAAAAPAPGAGENPGAPPPAAPAAGESPPAQAAVPAAAPTPTAEPPATPPVAAAGAAAPPPEAKPAAAPARPAPAPAARTRSKHPAAVAAAKPAAASPRAAHAAAAAPHETTKPAAAPGKRAKDEDPDGTLPLTE